MALRFISLIIWRRFRPNQLETSVDIFVLSFNKRWLYGSLRVSFSLIQFTVKCLFNPAFENIRTTETDLIPQRMSHRKNEVKTSNGNIAFAPLNIEPQSTHTNARLIRWRSDTQRSADCGEQQRYQHTNKANLFDAYAEFVVFCSGRSDSVENKFLLRNGWILYKRACSEHNSKHRVWVFWKFLIALA